MGVHLTFVRAVDLDEWTQKQIDAMRLGGNGNARAFFRKHGFTDLSGGRAEKKYKSKAAVAYRAELAKLVDAEASKRGEGPEVVENGDTTDSASNLLANLELSSQNEQEEVARAKLAAARASGGGKLMQPKAKLASQNAGASKLNISATNSKMLLRKPKPGSSLAGSKLMKKKPSNVGSKLRVGKLTVKASVDGSAGDDDGFEDVAETQKKVAEAQEEEKRKVEELKNPPPPPVIAPPPEPVVELPKKSPETKKPPVSTMKQNMAKLQSMNTDFFSGL